MDKGGVLASASEIEAYHRRLVDALVEYSLFSQRTIIRHNGASEWKSSKFHGSVDFDLWPVDSPTMARSDRGRELPILALGPLEELERKNLVEIHGNNNYCWISWHERWERLSLQSPFQRRRGAEPKFMLSTVQWILFWGPPEGEIVQIARAEWDNARHIREKMKEHGLFESSRRHLAEDSDSAGQPHWHVDRVLELGDVDSFREHRGTELQELAHSVFAGRYLELQRVHLAMGGWRNELDCRTDHPAKWQAKYTEDVDDLVDWNISTLCYIKNQVPHVRGS